MSGRQAEVVVAAHGLRRSYGARDAVQGVELEIRRGEIVALLGPNGPGKTTVVEILAGFRGRSAGDVRVLGADPATAGADWRERIGVVLQESEPDPGLTVRECLELYAGYYRAPRAPAEILELVGLTGSAGTRTEHLSGGQRRRLDVGLALVGDPEVLFLDEPTTGFDPAARRATWETIERLRRLGTTIVLTTHAMDEAERLADRIAVIVAGRIVAEARPARSAAATAAPPSDRGRALPARGAPAGADARRAGCRARDRRDRLYSAAPNPVLATTGSVAALSFFVQAWLALAFFNTEPAADRRVVCAAVGPRVFARGRLLAGASLAALSATAAVAYPVIAGRFERTPGTGELVLCALASLAATTAGTGLAALFCEPLVRNRAIATLGLAACALLTVPLGPPAVAIAHALNTTRAADVPGRLAGDLAATAIFTVAVVVACTALWRRRE